jgi:hypothetical protein
MRIAENIFFMVLAAGFAHCMTRITDVENCALQVSSAQRVAYCSAPGHSETYCSPSVLLETR